MINKNTDYANHIDLSNKNNSHTKIINMIKPNSKVLEFGPAKGYMTKYLKQKLNCKVTCVELNSDFLPNIEPYSERIIISDIDKLDWKKEFPEPASFDTIIFSDVLEHLYDPWMAVESCRYLLKENGSFLASIPHIGYSGLVASLLRGNFKYRSMGLLDKTHIRFFNRNSIIELFEKNGFYLHIFDSVTLHWRDSEFKEELADAPPDLLELVSRAPDSFVYQFVVEAKLMSKENSILITQLERQVQYLKTSNGLAFGKFLLWTIGILLPKFVLKKILSRFRGK